MITPEYLKKGDKIAITCPAKKLPYAIPDAVALLESWGLEVVLGETVDAAYHQFAGDDALRTRDFQRFLDDDSIKAIIAARGGYGSIRILDRLDFGAFSRKPKWIVGFSDITVFHSHIQAVYGIPSIHGQMPLTIPDATRPSLESLRRALFGEQLEYHIANNGLYRAGNAQGVLAGGNLTLLMVLSGSVSALNLQDKILFLEDVGEYLYSIDRMMWHLQRSGQLARLKGLVAGGFTDLKDNDIPFGKTAEEIIWEHVSPYQYPVCFNFPAGHIADNHALVLGKNVNLIVEDQTTKLTFL